MKLRDLAGLLICALVSGTAAGANLGSVRTVTVIGVGEVAAAPDKAVVSMGAQAIEPQLAAARQKVTRSVQSFLEHTHELGIDDKYVQTSQLTVQPQYDWQPDARQQRLIGYLVERQLTVDLRDLQQLGVLLERSVSAGVNVVSGPEFGASHEDELQREALARAAVDARASAETLARSLGGKLGLPRQITASSIGLEPTMISYAMAKSEMTDAGAAETYQAGQITISAQVTAKFDLIAN